MFVQRQERRQARRCDEPRPGPGREAAAGQRLEARYAEPRDETRLRDVFAEGHEVDLVVALVHHAAVSDEHRRVESLLDGALQAAIRLRVESEPLGGHRAVQHQQAAAVHAVRSPQRLEFGVDPYQAVADELDPAVGARQRVESLQYSTTPATEAQAEDESIVYKKDIAVTAMQVAYDHRAAGQQWLRLRLRDLLSQ
mgnify:CR=1 FL=1